jgi:hypothetical protein
VPRHVNDSGAQAVAQRQGGEAEVNGDAPLLFLLQAVGVDAGQGGDERGLAVVNVPGGAEYRVEDACVRGGLNAGLGWFGRGESPFLAK